MRDMVNNTPVQLEPKQSVYDRITNTSFTRYLKFNNIQLI